jgi:GT2 family glycosyltransferase
MNKGYKIKYNSQSVVYHVGGATLQQGNPRKTELNFRNSLIMLTKNLPKRTLYQILFGRLILDGIAGIKFLLQGNFKHFVAILKAHQSFYIHFLIHYKKRENFQSEKYFRNKSIVYLYYIKKIKVFSEIINTKINIKN